MVPTFLGITLLTFAVARLAPGDPFQLDPENVSAAGVTAQHRADADRDAPIVVQYGRWLFKVAQLDFGRSFVDQRPVREKLAEALPRTALVSGLALLLGFGLAVPLGVFLATRERSVLARAVSASLAVVWSVPGFWVAVLLLLLFANPRVLDLFPFQGLGEGGALDLAWHLVLPVTCLAYPTLAVATRQVRAAMREALSQEYIRAARARGIPERSVVWRHALRNSLLPVVTLLGLYLPHLVGGSVVIERVFGIPGMGLLAFDSIGTRDYPAVMGVATAMAVVTMVSMLLVDLAYGVIDPRIDQSPVPEPEPAA